MEWIWSGERPDDHHRWHRCVYMHCIIRNLCYHQVAKPIVITTYNTLCDTYEMLSHIPCRVAAAQGSRIIAWERYYNALTRENALACILQERERSFATRPWVSTRTNRARGWWEFDCKSFWFMIAYTCSACSLPLHGWSDCERRGLAQIQ